jgi:hypothetical protein
MGRFISASTFTTEIVNVSSATFNASSGRTYIVDTTNTPVTLNIPSVGDANVGDRIAIVDATGNWAVNNVTVTVNTGTTKIANLNENLILNIPNNSVELLYSGSTYGWVILNS